MKTRLFAAILLAACAVSGFAEEDPLRFSVNGYGKVFYEANQFDVVFGVVTEHDSVTECASDHQATLESILDYTESLKATGAIVGQASTDLSIHYRGSGDSKRPFYRYQSIYSIRLNDSHQLLPVQSRLVALGVNRIIDVKLLSSDLNDLSNQARRLAIADAKAKADLAAGELGWKLGRITTMKFHEDRWSSGKLSSTYGSRSNLTSQSSSNTSAADVFVDSTVTLTLEFSTIQ